MWVDGWQDGGQGSPSFDTRWGGGEGGGRRVKGRVRKKRVKSKQGVGTREGEAPAEEGKGREGKRGEARHWRELLPFVIIAIMILSLLSSIMIW